MAYRTFGDLKTQLETELDLETEDFIQPAELVYYFNSAIRETESEIEKLGLREKYLQDEAYISTVSGTSDYSLPTDIIDTQIRKIIYRDGNIIYTLKPNIREDSYEAEDVFKLYSGTDYYSYSIYKTSENYVIRLTPKSAKTVTDALRVIYWKKLNRYVDDSTNCDVPEIAYEFIRFHVRWQCFMKEFLTNPGGANAAKADLEALRKMLQETLQGQVADPDMNDVEKDLSVYWEHS